MNAFRRNTGTIVSINFQLLGVAIFGFVAWASWPDEPEWWAMGLFSFLFWLAALSSLGNAVRAMMALYTREKVVAAFMAQGNAPKSSKVATTDQLIKAGMIDE